MRFTKMQGLGNDYLYVYGEVPEDIKEVSINLSNRHFGVGADGIIYISPSKIADFTMRIFNADGSEAKMCGNGIRCVGKYVYDKGYTDKTHLDIETLSGVKHLDLNIRGGKVKTVCVGMGKVIVEENKRLNINGENIDCIPVSVGNPHAVIFVNDISFVKVEDLGNKIETHKEFDGGVNVEFVQVIDRLTLRMRVWERGSGVTMACGTGACASVSAAIKKGCCPFNEWITVKLDGGDLQVKILENNLVYMQGPAEFVFEGEIIC